MSSVRADMRSGPLIAGRTARCETEVTFPPHFCARLDAMTNRILISAVSALALCAWDGAAKAQQPAPEQDRAAELAAMAGADAARIIRELAAIGYRVTEVRRSFLGRIRIIAENAEFRREIVISSSTGEIKRDTVEARVAEAHRNGVVGDGNADGGGNVKTFGGSGNGRGNSGGGNGNSGGGNGNPGGGNGNSGGGNGTPGGGNGGNGKDK